MASGTKALVAIWVLAQFFWGSKTIRAADGRVAPISEGLTIDLNHAASKKGLRDRDMTIPLLQKSIAELNEEAGWCSPRIYVPPEEDIARGTWAVLSEIVDENGEPDLSSPLHVVPIYGKYHEVDGKCWCGPMQSMEPAWNGMYWWEHRSSQ